MRASVGTSGVRVGRVGRSLRALLIVSAIVSCKNEASQESTASPSKEPSPPGAKATFHCLKVSRGDGRICAGPGLVPSYSDGAPAKDADLFETGEAWCFVARKSWADARSIMMCLPTEKDCDDATKVRDTDSRLVIAPATSTKSDKLRPYVREACARTLPSQWTKELTPWHGKQDGFICGDATHQLKQNRANGKGEVNVCAAVPAEAVSADSKLVPKAWCYAYTLESTSLAFCFPDATDCESERRGFVKASGGSGQYQLGRVDQACSEEGPQRDLTGGSLSHDIRKQLGQN